MTRYYVEIHEEGHRLPVGNRGGYATLDEAKAEAMRRVDDALPHNTVHVLKDVGHGWFGGDGSEYWTDAG